MLQVLIGLLYYNNRIILQNVHGILPYLGTYDNSSICILE